MGESDILLAGISDGGLCGDGGVVDCALSSMIIPVPNYEECYREDIIVYLFTDGRSNLVFSPRDNSHPEL